MNRYTPLTEKVFLSGNEAIALGAHEADVRVAASYPGTPSTEILENLSLYEDIYCEWSPNEKVALEVALGASFAGVRALAAMKHVGLNVAADPLFTAAYTGVRGGLVIVTADDPSMHSSQNEQDSRNYALAAKIPMLEPSDSREAKEFAKRAFTLSERFDIPVLVRITTRVAHVKSIVEKGDIERSAVQAGIVKVPDKLVMLPEQARDRRIALERRIERLRAFADECPENRIEWGDRERGFITSGVSYLYVKEAFPDASVLKLGMVYPFPEKTIRAFAGFVDEVIIVEELDPFIETHVKAMGIKCKGKGLIPAVGEINARTVKEGISGTASLPDVFAPVDVPVRPPNMCPGCPHRGLLYALSKLDVFVAGDIGCYTLGSLKPLSAVDSTVCMGASIGNALGIEKALGESARGRVVAVIGDSTFIHSGITGLIDTVYNKGFTTVVILDNRITAMTGLQHNPVSGKTLVGENSIEIDLEALCKAIGVRNVYTVIPHDIDGTCELLKREIRRPGPSVIIARSPCVLLPEEKVREKTPYTVAGDVCTGCKSCLEIGCPAIEWVHIKSEGDPGSNEKYNGYARINGLFCSGCSQCVRLCTFQAIVEDD